MATKRGMTKMSKTCFASVLKKREKAQKVQVEGKKSSTKRKKSPARKKRTEQSSRAWKAQSEALVHKYNQADLDKLQSVYYNHANRICHTMPRNAEEYHKAVRVLFGVTIPYTSCSDEMDAPFTYFYDLMMAINETVVVIAPRAGSKTYYTSIAHFLVNMWLPQHISVHAGGTESQAMYSSDYLQDFAEVPVLASTLTKRPARLSANWLNGSKWFISKSSRSGISGSHPHKLTGDEVEFWKPSGIRQALGNAIPYDRYGIYRQAQTIFFSTRQTVTGGAFWLTEEADKRGFKKYEWSIFEVMKPCTTCVAIDRNPFGSDADKMQTCLLWEDCQGVKARKSTGWIPRRRVIATKRKNSQEDWDSQYLCVKPATGGLVYPEFIHEYGPNGNYTDAEYDPELPLYAWSDPSEGATAVVYLVQISRCGNFLNIIDEIVVDRCPNTMTLKREVSDHIETFGYDIPEYIVIDPHRRDAGADWEEGTATGTGINRSWQVVYPSGKKELGGQEIVRTISMCKKYICTAAGKRILKVNPVNCPRLCKAIKGYAYKVDDEGMRIGANPQKRFSDEMDTFRYGLLYFDQNSVISVSNGASRSRITVLAG